MSKQPISWCQDFAYPEIILTAEAITRIDSEMPAKTSVYAFFLFIDTIFFPFHADASPPITLSFCQRQEADVS